MCKNLFFIKTIYQAPDDAIVPRQLGDDDLSHLYSIRITSFPERCFFQGQNSLCGSTRTIHLKGLPYACVGTYYNWHRLWKCQPCCATQAPNPRGYDEATIPCRLGNDGLNCLYSTRVTFLPKKTFFQGQNSLCDSSETYHVRVWAHIIVDVIYENASHVALPKLLVWEVIMMSLPPSARR